jgi:dehydrogenase/reductase SDR family protein 7B
LAYSDSLRAELFAHKNINVVTVHPGYINTNLSMNALTSSGSANNQSDENQKNGFSTQHVAWEIIDAIVARKKEVIVAILLHRLAIWIRFFLPTLYFKIMASRARKAA